MQEWKGPGRARVNDWRKLADFLAGLPEDDRARFSRYAALDLPQDPEEIAARLQAHAADNPAATPSGLLAITGAQAGAARDLDFARGIGRVALDFAEDSEEDQLAHVCLAQTHFQNRREEEDLAAFEEHCRAAIDLGHEGTFCYERLAVLYEYRGETEKAAEVCRKAVEALERVGDTRSAERFRKKLERLAHKGPG